jgi:hypothetical protein
VVHADLFSIARRLEAHAQAARGALADQTRALASDSRIWIDLACKAKRIGSPRRADRCRRIVDAQAELKSPSTVRRYMATIAHRDVR